MRRVARHREDVPDALRVRAEQHAFETHDRRVARCDVRDRLDPHSRSIATDAISAFIRARAIGLSLMSTKPTRPDSRSVRATSSTAVVRAALRRIELDGDDPLAFPQRARERRLVGSRRGRRRRLLVARLERRARRALRRRPRSRIASICAGVVPQQPADDPGAERDACAANSAKYSGVACG